VLRDGRQNLARLRQINLPRNRAKFRDPRELAFVLSLDPQARRNVSGIQDSNALNRENGRRAGRLLRSATSRQVGLHPGHDVLPHSFSWSSTSRDRDAGCRLGSATGEGEFGGALCTLAEASGWLQKVSF
jgi:hypothetical protein